MEFSQSTLIDVGLSVTGYLAAGGLWMVLYSLFTGRGKMPVAATAGSPADAATRAAIGSAVRDRRVLQYVDLRGSGDNPAPVNRIMQEGLRADQYRRNRTEVVRLAREMLKDGRSNEEVRDLLPISEGELALLNTR
jgi:hypothetical protein